VGACACVGARAGLARGGACMPTSCVRREAASHPIPSPTPACPQLDISEGGNINASALKQIKAGGDHVGLRAYDPG